MLLVILDQLEKQVLVVKLDQLEKQVILEQRVKLELLDQQAYLEICTAQFLFLKLPSQLLEIIFLLQFQQVLLI